MVSREKIDLKVGEVELGKMELHEFIEPSMIILSDYSKEENKYLHKNLINSLLDKFRSIQWLFYHIMDLKDRMRSLEGRIDGHNTHVDAERERFCYGFLG